MLRYSSRRDRLDQTFLNQRLVNAQSYDLIAGYFRSSILEVAGEALDTIQGTIRVICNSDLNLQDVQTAKAAKIAQRREWCAAEPEKYGEKAKPRFQRLYNLLSSQKLHIRVLPREKFGLVHGKAGVITLADGRQTAFMGSTNETREAWKLHYELVWEDDSPEVVQWVQEEFDALWHHHLAYDLADFVVEDIGRIAHRKVYPSVEVWREEADPASPIIETPVFRKEFGLWAHQKYFVKLAFDAHKSPHGARFVLADMVGLGKTMQLALSAMLMALYGDKPILVLAPKPLLTQWQGELNSLLEMPSAVWNGRQWIDENGLEYLASGPAGIRKCPRRVGIVSQGLITSKSEAANHLKQLQYECVIVDESHRARRSNLGPDREAETPAPNNLLAFLYEIAYRTKSILLATATPVQLYPVEAWDLLDVLAQNDESVLGNTWSYWRKADRALSMTMGESTLPDEDDERWRWVRNPLPPASEGIDFRNIRRSLNLSDDTAIAPGDAWEKLNAPDKARIRKLSRDFTQHHNPFIRHIVRRTRDFLENEIDPETNEPYLKPVKVELLGDRDEDAIRLPPYLKDAYELAEEFCELIGRGMQGSGFLKTLLLRRVGSTIHAGAKTAEKMLGAWEDIEEEEDEEDRQEKPRSLTPKERDILQQFLDKLEANKEDDPKYQVVLDLLVNQGWLEEGCIIFSQYFDSIHWLGERLSRDLPEGEPIGLYAGGQKSGVIVNGIFERKDRNDLKDRVRYGDLRLLLGTESASEGLNLQTLGTLINLDLPWNPTRLEQRKGRIQRIGQIRDVVKVYNMRYRGSVEDRVHELLSDRLQTTYQLFGQIPDVLEDVWVDVALGEIEKAQQTINAVPTQHPFELKYNQIQAVSWESCSQVLDSRDRQQQLRKGW
ncbi:phospholipase D-like domain-containing anti-phage protein [Halomicronema sp. CCY15110]|uniref:phospholipase D-like domain-containing anti-phage protein n=1 Tax=Halomicronema sp. CCY15110 TaxID=2767773 RepID=UPI0019509FAB|nr:phospholipase D-like domain-containing anti-phage protein [Halomicronema sp. CCY15110]